MKKTVIIISLLAATFGYAQVAIGKTSVSNSSVSLEFGNANRGIVLPWVTSAAAVTGAVDGTFIYDTSDKKVKYRNNGAWVDLSVDATGVVDTTLQDSKTEQPNAKVVIGSNASSDTTPGILVLKDTDKVFILPKVASPHLNIVNPAAGMMAYDTVKKQIAVFNGTVWSFWKP
jgi:predicted homoserine dehydrogenase-like protein